jgi:serine/threonine protein kinase
LTAFSPAPFGKYYLVDLIARGGMAEIFKAKSFGHGGFEKLLVIKRILEHFSENEDFVAMFIDEANVSVALQHANIVQTFDFGKIGKNYYIAMEYVEGKDVTAILRTLAQRGKLLPIEFSAYIAHEICKGLDYAHHRTDLRGAELGIVHRDISPSNIIISYDGEVKIADFGIAKAQNKSYTTKDGVLKGKFEYMSPEQASGLEIDHRSDIFSTGIILHSCLTGTRLFRTESDVRTLESIRACAVAPPSTLNDQVPARLDQIVLRALARNPADRYQEARDFQNDLLEFLYPASPDLTRQSFSHFLRELFADDIRREHRRLEEGSQIAAELHGRPSVEWDATGPTNVSKLPRPSRWPISFGVAGGLALIAAALSFVLWPRSAPPEAPPPATIEVRVQVPAEVWFDGKLVGRASAVLVDQVVPGTEHTLRVSASGYKDFEDKVTVEEGDQLKMPVYLAEEGASEQVSGVLESPGDATAAHLAVDAASSPSFAPPGAGVAATSRSIESQVPDASRKGTAGRATQPPDATGRGKISINVSSSWAHVYVDGKELGDTPLANVSLTAGTHTVRVQNTDLGIDATQSVTVSSGGSAQVFFKVE